MDKPDYPCDQCHQPVELEGFCFEADSGLKRFCCEGCLSIYRLLNPVLSPKNNKEEDKKS